MKYIIHIGQSKTGTSSLQSFLAQNRKALHSQGFLFPDVFIGNSPLNIVEHNALADQLSGFTRYPNLSAEEYFRQFEEQATTHNCHTTILSAESFFGAPQIWRVPNEARFWEAQRRKVETLSQFLKNEDTKIIAYLRPQSDWFESALSHIIRTEGLLGHHIYEDDQQLSEFLKPHMDYKRILNLWSAEFSSESLLVRPFDRKTLHNESIIDDFCVTISLETGELEFPEKKENEGLDRRYVWLKTQLNRKKKSKAKERVIIALLGALSTQLGNIKKYSIHPTLRTKIDSFYIPLNDRLCREYSIKTPNTLTTLSEITNQENVTDEEKLSAQRAYNKSIYSSNALRLFMRYGSGALLRQYTPSLNSFLKNLLKI